MGCIHTDAEELRAPRPGQSVYREDCTQCFDSIDDPPGLNVCLHCFNGGCAGARNHAELHHRRSGHPLALNIKRTKKPTLQHEPPQKMSKLAITEQTEDQSDTTTHVICYECCEESIDISSGKLPTVINGVMRALTFSRQEEVKAWEQEYIPCEHTLCLEQCSSQDEPDKIRQKDLSRCSMCDLRENLWICLKCGNVGCGRSQFGGIGGNSHALQHADSTQHTVVVKLGSITSEGTADVFCYACNEERIDPELAVHLSHWGINISEREKTEKSLVEMQIEQNLTWDFSVTADGQDSKQVFGPGLTGLKNLGNSCYLSSVIQCLFAIQSFQKRYFRPFEEPPLVAAPAEDLETQLRKIADGLLSGRYSLPERHHSSESNGRGQRGIAPAMFKHLLGRGHEEFSTMRQQDAFEFFQHVLKKVSLSKHKSDDLRDPVDSFRFALEQRMQCLSCKGVKYKVDEQDNLTVPVPARKTDSAENKNYFNDGAASKPIFDPVCLRECLDIFTSDETVEMTCPGCGSREGFTKKILFKTFPETLAINVQRFALINWVPTKLDIPIYVDDEPLDLSQYSSPGYQETETLLPDDSLISGTSQFLPNQSILEQLLSMGFPEKRCQMSLAVTGNNDLEAALNWIFAHMDDPDIDETTQILPASGRNVEDPGKIAQLVDMGISEEKAQKSLNETDGDISRALDWIFSHPNDHTILGNGGNIQSSPKGLPGTDKQGAKFQLESIICHKGTSVHTGHYVAFIKKRLSDLKSPSWILFNDEKVVIATDAEETKKFAYVYFLQRLNTN